MTKQETHTVQCIFQRGASYYIMEESIFRRIFLSTLNMVVPLSSCSNMQHDDREHSDLHLVILCFLDYFVFGLKQSYGSNSVADEQIYGISCCRLFYEPEI